jgi:hypothetical protein
MTTQRRKKATFALDEAVLEEAKAVARQANYKSLNAFVEMAIAQLIQQYRKAEIRRELMAASQDPLFLADIAQVQQDFEHTDWESLEKQP